MSILDESLSQNKALFADEAPSRPFTIPALKEWNSRPEATYTFSAQTRIISIPELSQVASVLAQDLERLSGYTLAIVEAAPQNGDIVLALQDIDASLGEEGYLLNVADVVTISARTESGVFYGTRTLLQLLTQDYTIRGGEARDWPDYPQRALMVDVGRKFFSIEWLENHIRELAYFKYNVFQLHLTDTHGFRLESETHPEITSPEHYTKAQIRELVKLAQDYYITIIPEIDMPAHMQPILAKHPELQLTGPLENRVPGEHGPDELILERRPDYLAKDPDKMRRVGDIDLSNPAAYELAKEIIEEYLDLFPGPYWHVGADEYLLFDNYENYPKLLEYARKTYGPTANGRDAYLGFVNWANKLIKSHGKITRAWSDGLHGGSAVTIDSDIIFDHWRTFGLLPEAIVAGGSQIVNSSYDDLYYILTENGVHHADPVKLYERFEPHMFQENHVIEPNHHLNLGAKLHIWCDVPELVPEQQITKDIQGSLRALAQKNWGSPRLVESYEAFQPIMAQVGHAPGYTLDKA